MTLRQHPVFTGTAAERPTTGAHAGQHYVATDTGAASVWDGSAWVASGGAGGSAFAVRNSSNLDKCYPSLANATTLTSNSGLAAWTYPASFSQLVASTTAAFNAHSIDEMLQAIPQTSGTKRFVYEVEIATGAAGSEVVIARYSNALMAAITNVDANDSLNVGRSYPMGPLDIASGTRLSARARCELAGTAVLMNVTLYVRGYETVPASDTTYNLDDHLGGTNAPNLLATPTGSTLSLGASTFGVGYGTPVEVWSAAGSTEDRLVWGLQGYLTGGIANGSSHVQFGIGASGSETWYALLGLPGKAAIGCGQFMLRRPFKANSGERLAIRRTSSNTSAWNVQVLYETL